MDKFGRNEVLGVQTAAHMASHCTFTDTEMAEYPDNLIKEFKSKVEEAISLLPQIPEVHRHEVWTYWQIISVAVKAAVGGRGPAVAKQTAAARQARPRGRPRLNAQQSSGDKTPGEKKGYGRGVRKPGRKVEKQKVSYRKNKCHPDEQRDGFGGRIVPPMDKSSVASASISATVVTSKQSSFTADGANHLRHLLSFPNAAERPILSVNMDSSEDRINPSVPVENNATTVHTARNSSTSQDDFISQPVVGASAVELPDSLGCDSSVILKTHTMNALQLASKPHAGKESKTGEKQTAYNVEGDLARQASEGMEMSSDQTAQRPLILTVSLPVHETSQNKTHRNETKSEILIISPSEVDVSAKCTPTIIMESELERERHFAESAKSHNETVAESVIQISNKSAMENTSVQILGNSPAETVQPASCDETSQSQRIVSDGEVTQQCQNLPSVSLDHSSTDKVTTDSTEPNKISLQTKSATLACGSTVGAKRKRGRPRKHKLEQDSQAATSPYSTPLPSCQSDKPSQTSAVCTESLHKETEVSSSNNEKELTLTDTVPRSKNKYNKVPSRNPALAAVRRSGRRAAPNRDKLFCYFTPSQQGKVEEEDVELKVKEKAEDEAEEDEGCIEDGDNEERVSDTGNAEEEEVKEEGKEKTEEEKKQTTCPKCHVVLMSASSLTAHMRIHTGERPFACPVCHKTFTTKGNCERHEVTHVGLKAFTCPQCNKKFTEKKSLKIHMRAHTGERPYQCKQCGMRFFQSGTLKTHMDRHTGHKGHLCELCGKAFRQSCQLRVHMRRHKLHMPFQCQHCSRTFYTKSDMERHELKHTGERPFSCDQCPKTFTRVQYLREHQNAHLGRRPYRCVTCGMAFHTLVACHRHVSKHRLAQEQQQNHHHHHTEEQIAQHAEQQICLEVAPADDNPMHQVIEQVQVIVDQQHLADFHQTPHIQTFIIPDQSIPAAAATTTTTDPPGALTGSNPQPSAHTILSNLGLEVEESSEMYHVTLVDPSSSITIPADQGLVSTMSAADFSAINLLANATTQLSAPPPLP